MHAVGAAQVLESVTARVGVCEKVDRVIASGPVWRHPEDLAAAAQEFLAEGPSLALVGRAAPAILLSLEV